MSFNTQRVGGIVTESTSGTAEAVVFDVELYNISPISPSVAMSNQGVLGGAKTVAPHEYIGTREGTVTFDVNLAGSGDNTTDPKVAKLFEAGGFIPVAGTPKTWKMDGTNPCSTLTYEGYNYECGTNPVGVKSQLTGAVPVLTIGADAVGSVIKVNASLTGALQKDTDIIAGAPKVVAGNDTEKGLVFKGGVYTIGGVARSLKSWSFVTGAEIAPETDATNGDTCIAKHFIKSLVGRQLTMEFTKVPQSVQDTMGDFFGETIYSEIVISFNNPVTGQVGKMVFTLAQAISLADNDADAYSTQTATYNVHDAIITFDSIA